MDWTDKHNGKLVDEIGYVLFILRALTLFFSPLHVKTWYMYSGLFSISLLLCWKRDGTIYSSMQHFPLDEIYFTSNQHTVGKFYFLSSFLRTASSSSICFSTLQATLWWCFVIALHGSPFVQNVWFLSFIAVHYASATYFSIWHSGMHLSCCWLLYSSEETRSCYNKRQIPKSQWLKIQLFISYLHQFHYWAQCSSVTL